MSAALSIAPNHQVRNIAAIVRDHAPGELAALRVEREALAVKLRQVQARIGALELLAAVAGEPEA